MLMETPLVLYILIIIKFWAEKRENPWNYVTMSKHWLHDDCMMTFSFWVDWLGSVLPSFLHSTFQPCLSLVSWANRQRRGQWWTCTTSNAHQTLQPEDSQELWSSARLRPCLSSKKRKKKKKPVLERAVLHRWGCQAGGEWCKTTFNLLFVSVFFCSALSEPGVQGGEKMRISGLMSSGNSILIYLQSFLSV